MGTTIKDYPAGRDAGELQRTSGRYIKRYLAVLPFLLCMLPQTAQAQCGPYGCQAPDPPSISAPGHSKSGSFKVEASNSLGTYGYVKWDGGPTVHDDNPAVWSISGKGTGSYSYRAKLCFAQDNTCSSWSSYKTVYVLRTPGKPSFGGITDNACNASLTVGWSPGSGYPSGASKRYHLQESVNGGSWTDQLYNATASAWSRGTTERATYRYRVRSRYKWNGYYSSWSGWVYTSTFTMPECPPGAVPDLTAGQLNPDSPDTYVEVSWGPAPVAVGTVLGYRVQRRLAGGSWPPDGDQDGQYHCEGNLSACEYNALERGETYEYRVRAYKSTVTGPWTVLAHTVAWATPPAPPRPTFEAVEPHAYTVTWNPVGDADTGPVTYRLWEKAGAQTGVWTDVGEATGRTYTGREPVTDYEYRVRACNPDGLCGGQSPERTLSFPGTPGPVEVLDVANAGRDYTVRWGAAPGEVERYELMRSGDGGQSWSEIADADLEPLAEAFANAPPGTEYRYKVRACNPLACGQYTGVQGYWVPQAPMNLAGEPDPDNAALVLSWSGSEQAEHYHVQQSADGGAGWESFVTASTAYTFTGLSNGTTYHYRLKSCGADGCSAYTEPLDVHLPYAAPGRPGALEHAAGEDDPAGGALTVRWSAPGTIDTAIAPLTHYQVAYSANGGALWQAAPTGGAVPGRVEAPGAAPGAPAAATLSGLTAGAPYSVRVRGCNADTCGAYTDPIQVHLPHPAPAAPEVLPTDTTPGTEDHQARRFTVQWTAPSGTVHHYQLQAYAGTEQGHENWPDVARTLQANTYTFTDRRYGKTYRYRVRACSEPQSEDPVCSAWAVTDDLRLPYPAPNPPAGVAVGDIDHVNGRYTLAWNGVLGWAPQYRYRIEESADGGTSWSALAETLDPEHEVSVSGRTPGTYTYRVRACNPEPDNDCSGWSAETRAEVLATPPAPAGIAASAGYCRLEVTWTPPAQPSQGEYRYELEYRIGSGSWTDLAWTSGTGYEFSNADDSQSYSFRVRARTFSDGRYSPWGAWRTGAGVSPGACDHSLHDQDNGLTLLAPRYNETGQYSVYMTASVSDPNTTATRYRHSVNGGAWADFPSGQTTYTAATARATGKYRYRVGKCVHPDLHNGNYCTQWNEYDQLLSQTTVLRSPGSVAPVTIGASPDPVDGAYVLSGSQFTLSWQSAPVSSGPSSYNYEIQQRRAGAQEWDLLGTQTGTSRSVTLPEFGAAYEYRVRACARLDDYVNCNSWTKLNYPVKQSVGAPRFAVNTYPADGELVIYDKRVPLQWLPPWNMAEAGAFDHYEISIRSWQSLDGDGDGAPDGVWIGPEVLATPAPVPGDNTDPPVQQAMVAIEQGGQKEFLIRACGTPDPASCGAALRFEITVIVPPEPPRPVPLIGQSDPDFSAGDAFNGALSGEFSVQPSGAAAYTLPIVVPPGTAGMQPELSLSYNSQAGNGIAGWGWSLSAGSVITYCHKTPVRYGEGRSNAGYCLDGQHLIPTGGGEYRTERNDFRKIVKHTSGDNTWFEVKTRSGRILQYGNTDDSKSYRAWALNRVTDRSGNYIRYQYLESPVGEEPRAFTVVAIDYTGHPSLPEPYTSVNFEYEERADVMGGYQGGRKSVQTKRLRKISTDAGVYAMRYLETADENPASRLESIKYCESDPDIDPATECMDKLSFEWNEVGEGWAPLPDIYAFPYALVDAAGNDGAARLVDLDNDGLQDLIYASASGERGAYRNTGEGWANWSTYTPPSGIAFVDANGKDNGVRFADVTGDGQPDLLNNMEVYRNTGSGWSRRFPDLPVGFVTADRNDGGLRIADLNNDGLSDLVLGYQGDRRAWLNAGQQWEPSDGYAPEADFVLAGGRVTHSQLVDLNGDGLVDMFVESFEEYTTDEYTVAERQIYGAYFNAGDGWHEPTHQVLSFMDEGELYFEAQNAYRLVIDGAQEDEPRPPDTGVRLADVNGDGLPDLFVGLDIEGTAIKRFRLNSGGEWASGGPSDDETPVFVDAQGRKKGVRLVDINADGRADILDDDAVRLSSDGGWIVNEHFTAPVAFTGADGEDRGIRLVDVTGDGQPDIVHNQNGVKQAWENLAGRHRLTAIVEGQSNTREIRYKTLTDPEPSAGRTAPIYTRADSNLDEPAEQEAALARAVVDRVSVDDGIGGRLTTEYAYKGLTVDTSGRGLQGFEEITIHRPDGTARTTRYARRFPYTGRPLEVATTYGSGPGALVLKNVSHQYCYAASSDAIDPETVGFDSAQHGTCGDYDDAARFGESVYVFLDKTIAEENRLNDDLTGIADTVTRTTEYTYGAFGHRLTSREQTTGDGHTYTTETVNEYDPYEERHWLGQLESTAVHRTSSATADSSTRKVEYDYNADGLLSRETRLDPVNGTPLLRTVYDYDMFGNRTVTTVCATDFASCQPGATNTGGAEPFRTSTVSYDPLDYAPGTLDYANGRFAVKVTDALGNAEYREHDSARGVQTSLVGPNTTTSWTHDWLGRKTGETTPFGTTERHYRKADNGYVPLAHYSIEVDPPGGAPVRTYYDARGRERRVLTQNVHGEWVAADIEYDRFGRVKRESQPYFVYTTTGGDAYWTTNEHDALGRLQTAQVPLGDIDNDGADDGHALSSIEYRGFETVTTDARGRRKLEEQDALGRTVRRVNDLDGENIATTYAYDSRDNLIETMVNGDPATTVTIQYDQLGYKKQMSDPDTGQWQYRYNGYGDLIRQVDASGQVTLAQYDALGRMIRRADDAVADDPYADLSSEPRLSTWDYHGPGAADGARGKLDIEAGPSGSNKTYSYDNNGQVTAVTHTLGPDRTFQVQREYDGFGRLARVTYPSPGDSPFAVENRYSPYGGLWYVLDVNQDDVLWIANMVDERGRIMQETLRNQNIVNNQYNHATGWLKKVESWDADLEMIQQTRHAYDKTGNMTWRERFRPWVVNPDGSFYAADTEEVRETFTYDGLDRLTGATLTRNGMQESAGQYSYNALGNLTAKDGHSYTYNSCAAGPHAVCTAGTQSFDYDANGNLTGSSGGATTRTLGYSAFNKPVSIQTEGEHATTASFAYGADRSRIYKQVTADGYTESTWYVRSGNATLFQLNERLDGTAPPVTEYLHFIYAGHYHNGQPFAVRVEEEAGGKTVLSGTEYYHRDHLGSVIAVTDDHGIRADAGGKVHARLMSFDAWGKRREHDWSEGDTDQYSPSSRGNLDYTGHEAVPEVGLIHMNGRVYDPELGRFLSPDPFVQAPDNSQSFNRYSYVMNNPLRYTDPSGYVAEEGFSAEDPVYRENYDNKPMPEIWVTEPRPRAPMPDWGGVPDFDEIDWDFGPSWSFEVTTDWGGTGADWGYYYSMPTMTYELEPWGGQDFSGSQSFSQSGQGSNQGGQGQLDQSQTSGYWERVGENFMDTNSALGGQIARTGSSFLTAGALAQQVGTLSPLQWALTGFSPMKVGAAQLTFLESGVAAGGTALLNAAYSLASFETGAFAGSLINAIPLRADSSFRALGDHTVRDVTSGVIEQIHINYGFDDR